MLEHRRRDQQGRAAVYRHKDVGSADAEIRPALQDLGDGLNEPVLGERRSDFNVQTGSRVEALPKGGMVPGELGLMVPAKLEYDLVPSEGRGGRDA